MKTVNDIPHIMYWLRTTVSGVDRTNQRLELLCGREDTLSATAWSYLLMLIECNFRLESVIAVARKIKTVV